MMNVRGIQRNMKNVVKNYSDAQVKVREATSNDPWGPSSTLMGEIADLTYNVVAFSEIMQMIWKRLNDHGKNWRHVYKALVLLEYLIKTGTEKVAQQCKENIFAIQTLKDFQYLEENKDQGMNVREKSKSLVQLLKDDERLKIERARALKAKERFAQSASYMSNSSSAETIPKTSASYHESLSTIENSAAGAQASSEGNRNSQSELESARPLTLNEEELQLQLALAMSKEEAEQEERQRKNDDLRLQLALNESQKNSKTKQEKTSAIDDLLTLNLGTTAAAAAAAAGPWKNNNGLNDSLSPLSGNDAFGMSDNLNAIASNDPWSTSPTNIAVKSDPWTATSIRSGSANNDPWEPSPRTTPISADPWSPSHDDGFNATNATNENRSPITTGDCLMSNSINNNNNGVSMQTQNKRKTPETFLGANSNLVNLDALVSTKPTTSLPIGGNPFASQVASSNPFQAVKPPPPTINQLRSQTQFPMDLNTNTNTTPMMNNNNNNSTINNSNNLNNNFVGPINFHSTNDPFAALTTHSMASSSSPSLTGNNPFAM